jgi:hypothetical protein
VLAVVAPDDVQQRRRARVLPVVEQRGAEEMPQPQLQGPVVAGPSDAFPQETDRIGVPYANLEEVRR